MPLDRRAFLRASASVLALGTLPWPGGASDRRAAAFRIGLLLPGRGRDLDAAAVPAVDGAADAGSPSRRAVAFARMGARLGVEEAAHTLRLLGHELELTERFEAGAGADDEADADGAARDLDAFVWLRGHPAARPEAAANVPGPPLVLDGRARPEELPSGACEPGFRVGIGAATRRAALAVDPDLAREVATLPAGSGAGAGDSIVLWHPALGRYGATQLNERFARRFGAGMDEHAWAAWLAVKILSEAWLRARSAEPDALRAYLTSARARFDGHKGAPLYFAADGRLVQPVYRLNGARILQIDATPSPERHAC